MAQGGIAGFPDLLILPIGLIIGAVQDGQEIGVLNDPVPDLAGMLMELPGDMMRIPYPGRGEPDDHLLGPEA